MKKVLRMVGLTDKGDELQEPGHDYDNWTMNRNK